LVEQGIWRKRTSKELRELYKDTDKVADIKRERLEWIGCDKELHLRKYLGVSRWEVEEGEDLD